MTTSLLLAVLLLVPSSFSIANKSPRHVASAGGYSSFGNAGASSFASSYSGSYGGAAGVKGIYYLLINLIILFNINFVSIINLKVVVEDVVHQDLVLLHPLEAQVLEEQAQHPFHQLELL